MWKGQTTINWLHASSCDDSAHSLYWLHDKYFMKDGDDDLESCVFADGKVP